RIAEQDFDQAEIGKVAVERCGRPLSGLLDRMRRKFHRDTAGRADALAHPVRQFEMVAIARGEVVAGLRDADDRLAGLQFLAGQAVIEVALEIERGHSRVMRVVEPLEGTEFPALAIGGSFVVILFHWFLPHCKLVDGLSYGSDAPCQEFHLLQRACLLPSERSDPSSTQKIALPFSAG